MILRRDLLLIYAAALLRSLGVGLTGVVAGVYLARAGFSATRIGLVIAAGLAGAALATIVVSFWGDRLGRRGTLVTLALLSSLGALAFALTTSFVLLAPLVFFAMLNAMGTDRSAAFALEQAMVPALVTDRRRTWALAWFNLVQDGGGALGALAAGLPFLLHHWLRLDIMAGYRAVFFGIAGANALACHVYLLLSDAVEVTPPQALHRQTAALSPRSRHIVGRLASFFALDSFGGGFLTDALVAYWFFQRFGISEQGLGVFFFVVHVLNAVSHLGAAWMARRIGLLNTMVFTHLPSSLFLMAVPLAPSFKIAAVLFFLREAMVEMDVPSRQSYIAAVVAPHERTFASGITNLTRNVSWAAASSLAGVVMQYVAASAPLVLGGGIKVVYDLLLYRAFRGVKLPEEIRNGQGPAELHKQFASGETG
jgi:MFS family permease